MRRILLIVVFAAACGSTTEKGSDKALWCHNVSAFWRQIGIELYERTPGNKVHCLALCISADKFIPILFDNKKLFIGPHMPWRNLHQSMLL